MNKNIKKNVTLYIRKELALDTKILLMKTTGESLSSLVDRLIEDYLKSNLKNE